MSNDETKLQPIKYRVIGALVIVFTFMLAWWLLLDHDVKRFRSVKEPIPEPIMIERFEIIDISNNEQAAKDSPAVTVKEQDKPAAMPVDEAKENSTEQTTEKAEKPIKPQAENVKAMSKHDSQGLPEAWVLQVASFSDKDNAKQLQQKLYKADYPAYVKTFNVADSKVYRVLVGPKLSKQKAADMAKAIEKEFALKSMLMLFKPGYEE
jgi:DedD protein